MKSAVISLMQAENEKTIVSRSSVIFIVIKRSKFTEHYSANLNMIYHNEEIYAIY